MSETYKKYSIQVGIFVCSLDLQHKNDPLILTEKNSCGTIPSVNYDNKESYKAACELIEEITGIKAFDGIDGWIILDNKPFLIEEVSKNQLKIVYVSVVPAVIKLRDESKYEWKKSSLLINEIKDIKNLIIKASNSI